MDSSTDKSGDLSARILQPLLRYVDETYGAASLEKAVSASGLTADRLRHSPWMSHEQFEAVLAGARAAMRDDAEFTRACSFRMVESYGPIAHVVRAASTSTTYYLLARTLPLVSRISRYSIVESSRTSTLLRYSSERSESRLMCLSRRAQISFLRDLGLPEVFVEERSCISRGDASCDYYLRWHERARWPTVAIGFIGGAAVAAVAALWFHLPVAALITLPALGTAAAWLLELSRTNRENARAGDDVRRNFTKLVEESTATQEEILALTSRQDEWTEVLERQIDERTSVLHQVVDRVKKLREQRVVDLRGFTHDVRNPLAVLGLEIDLMAERPNDLVPVEVMRDMKLSVERIMALLDGMLESVMTEARSAQLAPDRIEIAPLADQLRRSLTALVMGRHIRVAVFPTREAPDSIESDRQIFARIVDNLLTNAAKYTRRGSIVVEIGGTPGMLCLKISDSGIGIAEEHIERIFFPGALPSAGKLPGSHGVGLSGVVRLLGRIGGRLEVLSKPSLGTTFWAYIPTLLPTPIDAPSQVDEPMEVLVGRVVHIRRSAS